MQELMHDMVLWMNVMDHLVDLKEKEMDQLEDLNVLSLLQLYKQCMVGVDHKPEKKEVTFVDKFGFDSHTETIDTTFDVELAARNATVPLIRSFLQ